jgi:outer membrane protein OmpA-like peptidoglycan-associated protein
MKSLNVSPNPKLLCLRTPLLIALTSVLMLGGCTSAPKSPEGAMAARERLTQLQNSPSLASRATIAIRTAESAVSDAEIPRKDKALSDHLVFVAQREVDVAWAQAQTRQLEDQRQGLSEAAANERLASRTREADQAHQDSDELRRQIAELNAKETERGLIVTLGDVLFETGKSQLKSSAADNLTKLSSFLKAYPERTLLIEGHTDNVGTEESNFTLSQLRAEAVLSYLLAQGISHNRLAAYGKGESAPVASNDSVSGRALNRRVEVVIANPSVAGAQKTIAH